MRELEGALRSAVILADDDLIDAGDLELDAISSSFQLPEPAEDFDMDGFLTGAREQLINRALEIANGNQTAATSFQERHHRTSVSS